jgi:site-specific DNA recombinase
VRTLKTGRMVGGIPFTRGPLAHLLRNRFYVGEVVFKGDTLPGEQPAIVDRDLFEAVQRSQRQGCPPSLPPTPRRADE